MSNEIYFKNESEPTSPIKYSKLEGDDCQLLLQETSLDDEVALPDKSTKTVNESPVELPVENTASRQLRTTHNHSLKTPIQASHLPFEDAKKSTSTTTTNVSNNSAISRDNHVKTSGNKPAPSSHKLFDFASIARFFGFRKEKKRTDTDSSIDANNIASDSNRTKGKTRRRFYSFQFNRKSTRRSNGGAANTNDQSISSMSDNKSSDNPNAFTRFVRTFSFLYKSNPRSSSNFKRSKSAQYNHRQTRSMPNIKTSSTQSRSMSTPISKASSSTSLTLSKQNTNNLKHSELKTDQTRAKIEVKKQFQLKPSPDQLSLTKPLCQNAEAKTFDSRVPKDQPDSAKKLDPKVTDVNNVMSPSVTKYHRHLVSSGIETPAVCGIQNHGNTCFINSVIQCLSNTNLFAEYFVLDYYRNDLAQHNKILAKKYGTRGELADHLAVLLKSLWACRYSSEISMKFKKIVSKFGNQYNGNEQHDAQEFLLWLLDKCHEDLTVQTMKSNGNKNSAFSLKIGHRKQNLIDDKIVNDETAAIEFLSRYQTSSSIIYDIFQGQLRSAVACRNCGHYSKTFDPYLCISLPVPMRLTLTIFVNAIYFENKITSREMFGISIKAAATLREIRDKISRMLKIPENRLILFQIDKNNGIMEFDNDVEMIQEIFEDYETIYVLETPIIPETLFNEEYADNSPASDTSVSRNMCQQMLTIVWLNRVGIGKEGPVFGPLFTTLVSRDISYRKLQSYILFTMSRYLVDGVKSNEISQNIHLRLRVIGGLSDKPYLSTDVDHPLFMPTVEHALFKTEDKKVYRGPYHLKLMVEWDFDIRRTILVGDDLFDTIFNEIPIVIDKSVEIAKDCSEKNNRTTLQDCLDIYFRDEKLTADNAWICSKCNTRQQCEKKLSVWSLPDIFIIHLKRFRYISNVRRIKINTMVEYPENGLDMIKYVAPRKFDTNCDTTPPKNNSMMNGGNNLSKPSNKKNKQNSIEETTYNLYAVCCHHGNMQGGHYTAYCKNSIDNCWYLYDDTKVAPVLEEAVITKDAYILFYQKSYLTENYLLKTNPSASSISSGYLSSITSSSNFNHHWASHMPPFNHYSNNSKSSTLPNRRILNSNSTAPGSNNGMNGSSSKIPNGNAVKHSEHYNNVYNGNDYSASQQPTRNESNNNNNNNNYAHHTFPRIKSK